MVILSPQNALWLVGLLQLKHVLADGPLQTSDMVVKKAVYGDFKGIAHALVHLAGTFIVFAAFAVPWGLAAALAGLDGVLHYHIDFAKQWLVRRQGWTPQDPTFWWTLTADQGLHNLTYILMVAVVAARAG
jgi:hypothetical protein